MINESMDLRALIEKTPDAELLREMIGLAAERLMELEVAGLTGAGYGEKSPERLAQRRYHDVSAAWLTLGRWKNGLSAGNKSEQAHCGDTGGNRVEQN
jgi:hypothetical protein